MNIWDIQIFSFCLHQNPLHMKTNGRADIIRIYRHQADPRIEYKEKKYASLSRCTRNTHSFYKANTKYKMLMCRSSLSLFHIRSFCWLSFKVLRCSVFDYTLTLLACLTEYLPTKTSSLFFSESGANKQSILHQTQCFKSFNLGMSSPFITCLSIF